MIKQSNDNDVQRNENYNLNTKLDAIRMDEGKYKNLFALLAANLDQLKVGSDVREDEQLELSEMYIAICNHNLDEKNKSTIGRLLRRSAS